jgi:hypothetical protein
MFMGDRAWWKGRKRDRDADDRQRTMSEPDRADKRAGRNERAAESTNHGEIRAIIAAREAVRGAEVIVAEEWRRHLVSLREESERELRIGVELRDEMRDRLRELRCRLDPRDLVSAEAELSAAERVTAEGEAEYARVDAYVSRELRHLGWAERRRAWETRSDERRLAGLRRADPRE